MLGKDFWLTYLEAATEDPPTDPCLPAACSPANVEDKPELGKANDEIDIYVHNALNSRALI